MTLTRRRVRVSKFIILVNTVGAVVGAKLSFIYFINIICQVQVYHRGNRHQNWQNHRGNRRQNSKNQ